MSETLQPLMRHPQPSYGFAKRHDVVVGEDPHGEIAVRYRPPLKVDVIAEIRRFVGAPVRLEAVDEDEFNQSLAQLYDQRGGDDIEHARGAKANDQRGQ